MYTYSLSFFRKKREKAEAYKGYPPNFISSSDFFKKYKELNLDIKSIKNLNVDSFPKPLATLNAKLLKKQKTASNIISEFINVESKRTKDSLLKIDSSLILAFKAIQAEDTFFSSFEGYLHERKSFIFQNQRFTYHQLEREKKALSIILNEKEDKSALINEALSTIFGCELANELDSDFKEGPLYSENVTKLSKQQAIQIRAAKKAENEVIQLDMELSMDIDAVRLKHQVKRQAVITRVRILLF